jgi:OmpA-OmpF porin, OOP family
MKWLILFLWALLLMIYFGIWSCNQTACCKPALVEKPIINTEPILFGWQSDSCILGNRYSVYLDSLMRLTRDGKQIVIMGQYKASEQNPSKFENLGIARAEAIKLLFSEKIPLDRISTRAELVGEDNKDHNLLSVCHGILFEPLKLVEEFENRAIIYHGYNTTDWDKNEQIISYLDKVASKLIKEGGHVLLIGHTDNVGNDEFNMKLGQSRSDAIKKYLLDKGVKASQMNTGTKGKSSPLVSNETEEGRAKNRRTELEFSK